MKPNARLILMLTSTILMAITGCEEDQDQQLVDLAKQTVSEQAHQNERLAEQHTQLAEASKKLVDADSQARREMLTAHAELEQQIEDRRVEVDRQRDHLEQDRKSIARDRHRDPIIAQSIAGFGMTIACLFPLALAAFVLHMIHRAPDNTAAIHDFLIHEMVARKPKLLAPPTDEYHRLETDRNEAIDSIEGDLPF